MIAEKLRKSVLQAAVEGKLTEQLPEDGNAHDLVLDIIAEKRHITKSGNSKTPARLPENKEEENPYQAPKSWAWQKLGAVMTVRGGKRIPVGRKLVDKDTGHMYIRVTNMKNGTIVDSDIKYVPDDIYEKIKNYTISKNDVYITVAGTIGQVGLVPEKFDGANLTENADKLVIYKNNKKYIYYMMSSPLVQNQIIDATTKVGQPKLAIKRIKALQILLPPLAEQERIVQRLDEILPQIDELEKVETELQSIEEAFPDKLKDSLLQAAIQGRLTEQLPEDGDARDLIVDIQTEKERLVKAGETKRQKKLPQITEDEIPFDIPENWCWVRFSDVVNFSLGKTPTRAEGQFWGDPYPWVSISDMEQGETVISTKEKITDLALQECFKGKLCPVGTLLMSFKLTIGKCSILGLESVHNEAIISIFPFIHHNVFRDYLMYALPLLSNLGDTKSAIKGKTLNSSSLSRLLIPLPPLAEQKRIVQRLEVILPLLNELA